ncbi:hypothetical protein B296_00022136 [Ensete ventricosum]|uniref:Uncharacterized protein n=1 Tax=Ensete ventricosum TaxID=4639 RepID=A0A427ARC1_ENSVE|nr:hypothetical protein B296_00022136 [Ensete ventricosum]
MYVKLSTEVAVGAELDVDALVEAEPYEIERLLHGALLLACHRSLPTPARLAPLLASGGRNPFGGSFPRK